MERQKKGRNDFYYDKAGVRMGNWKYLRANAEFYGYAKEKDRKIEEELYDLEADIGEQNNLASMYPDKVEELKKLLESIKLSGRKRKRKKTSTGK